MTLLSQQEPQTNSIFAVSSTGPTETKAFADREISDIVSDDGSVTYKGKTYQLYRRYTGKAVSFIEENNKLRFSIEGRVLSKSYRM